MFDLPVEAKAAVTVTADLPLEDKPWNVGLITGPSGAGKSTLARHLWPGALAGEYEWPADRALVDAFPEGMGIRDVTGLLSAVGLASPPAWVRPFRTLSNGEAFRASMARALAEAEGLVVVDEFSSVVDRQVAKVASHAVQKAVRRSGRQFVAVTCHYDVEDWLQPDWAYDVAAASFKWRSVQPHPEIRLDVYPAERRMWSLFSRHHYLSGSLLSSAKCWAAYVDGRPVAFTSCRKFPHATVRDIMLGHRLVVLPDWQGLGIAGRLDDWLGQHLHEQGYRYRNKIAHPVMIRYYAASPRWREAGARKKAVQTSTKRRQYASMSLNPRQLGLRSFEYVPPKAA